MNIKLRTATPDDAQRCGTICYDAFTAIANQYNFTADLPSAEVTIGLLSKLIADPRFYAIVAEFDHQVVDSNFMDERSALQASVRSRSIRLCKIRELDAH
jgi:hypothetical protein